MPRHTPGRVLLICNGEAPSRTLIRSLARRADLVVAADGGANTARACGIRVDVIIGDLDSIHPATTRYYRRSLLLHVPRQDNTDLEKALDYLAANGPREVAIVGATGGRLDFTLGNLSVFWNYLSFLDISFRGDGWRAVAVGNARSMRAARGTTVSLVPFGQCEGITLHGLHYPLRNAAMRVGEIGVSNVVLRSPFRVSVKRGNMLLILFEKHRARRGSARW
ncbi:MAG: thiamine diphosphokinase [Bacteroidota bacterium]